MRRRFKVVDRLAPIEENRMFRTHRLVPLAFAASLFAAPAASFAQVSIGVSVTVAPPPLPVYAQPVIPGPGYLWTPGYWAWGPYGYYWVPGTWVLPPAVGLLWTPGYWAWRDGVYLWHAGYWAPQIGFYGGIVYGFGYDGIGYHGGYWDHDRFHYNADVNNLRGVHVTDVYRRPMTYNVHVTHVSFNDGPSGTRAHASLAQERVEREHHAAPTALQMRHQDEARERRELRSSVNHGRPGIAATPRPTAFTGHGVIGSGVAPHREAPRGDVHQAPIQHGATISPGHAEPRVERGSVPHPASRPVHSSSGPEFGAAPHQAAPHTAPAAHGGPPHGETRGPAPGEAHGGKPHGHEAGANPHHAPERGEDHGRDNH
jgi:WXXGXW repeat (2 copies)